MKRTLKFLPFVLLAFVLIACENPFKGLDEELDKLKNEKTTYREIKFNDLYTMELPSYMRSTDDLNSDASMQYMSEDESKYIIVLDESIEDLEYLFEELADEYDSKNDLFDNYIQLQLEDLQSDFNFISEDEFVESTIGGKRLMRKRIIAEQDDIETPMAVQLGFIEGEETIYFIMTWSPRIMEDVFKEDQIRMIESLREL